MKTYIYNLETSKIELHFTKEEYLNLSDELKKELKSGYLFSRHCNAWVSRSKNDHYWAKKIALKLGFTEEERKGSRLTYEEELNIKAQKAENRIERYEQYSENAEKRAKTLQADRERYRGDISFWTQPIISGHSGSQRFANYRQKIIDRYNKGFEEYRKSEYFKEKASIAASTASMEQLNNKVYLNNKIEECKSNIRKFEKNIKWYEERGKEVSQDYLERFEYQIDKLAFFENKLEDLGGVQYNKDNLKAGYLANARHGWFKITKLNHKTIQGEYLAEHMKSCYCIHTYAEIKDIKIPENFQEEHKKLTTIENPFKPGDIFACDLHSNYRIWYAYQVIKTTSKTVTVQEIDIKDNKPVKDSFKPGSKPSNKKISMCKWKKEYRICIDDYAFYQYKEESENKKAV